MQQKAESLLCYTADTTSAKASTLKQNKITVTITLQMKTMQGKCKLVQSKLLFINPISPQNLDINYINEFNDQITPALTRKFPSESSTIFKWSVYRKHTITQYIK